jgi:hypothetical protein
LSDVRGISGVVGVKKNITNTTQVIPATVMDSCFQLLNLRVTLLKVDLRTSQVLQPHISGRQDHTVNRFEVIKAPRWRAQEILP